MESNGDDFGTWRIDYFLRCNWKIQTITYEYPNPLKIFIIRKKT